MARASLTPYQPLNWKELSLHIRGLAQEIEGLFAERLIVPERARYPGGFIKGEWALRLGGKKRECTLIFSVRPRHPYIYLLNGKGPRAAAEATHSPFSLALSKHIKGARLNELMTLPRERSVILRLGSEADELAVVLNLIPATPEALLCRPIGEEWPILARSRTLKEPLSHFKLPDGSAAPADLEIRADLVSHFAEAVEASLDLEAMTLRKAALERSLKDTLKQSRARLSQSEAAAAESSKEKDWQRLGDLLKSSMGMYSPEETARPLASRRVTDFETGEEIEIACDPKLSLKQQVEKFYQLARRKGRRFDEARSRAEGFKETIARAERDLEVLSKASDWPAIEKIEGGGAAPVARSSSSPTKGPRWLGRTFQSKDGMVILVGRSRDENLELTFRHARGNDLWMHVRGKPGAHVLIPLNPGKSAPLETLLDAAALTVYYSGGENWGKTEVDYTFKKHVKRIRDSTEASYTNNKTLLVTPDSERLKRLLDQFSK